MTTITTTTSNTTTITTTTYVVGFQNRTAIVASPSIGSIPKSSEDCIDGLNSLYGKLIA